MFSINELEIKYAITYRSCDSNIDDKWQVRDQGIMMSNTVTFTLHIRNTAEKSRNKMGWVLMVFQSRKRSLMLTLLKYLVIPLLDYCCQLWNPWKAKEIQAIEAIQRTFTYKITEIQHLNYWERLHELKWYSLQRRRESSIIVYICKITQHMHGAKYWRHNRAQNKKQKTHKDMEHSALCSVQQTETHHNPFKKMQ